MKRRVTKLWGIMMALVLSVTTILAVDFTKVSADTSEVVFTESAGYQEGAYAEWSPVTGADGYNAYVSADGTSWTKLDDELIRKYPDYWRVDALGLKAGRYTLKVVPVAGGKEQASAAKVTSELEVIAHDRTGFAWVNGTASGAYNEDGTLKNNAVVLYITEQTKDTITADVITSSKGAVTTSTGLQNILNSIKKGYDTRPFAIRLIGNITDLATMDKGDIVIDSVKQAVGLTFEGVGEDATANGWGLRVKGCSNVEVRNIGFMNCDSSEGDDVGLQQDNDHCWVHNCDMFYGHAGSDADQVKGDGALDTKKSKYITHSYNHFWDNGKCNLQGASASDTSNYITYHHNWYDHSDSRHPRIRVATTHVYNNYYDGNAKYGIGATTGSSVFAEGNYFRNCKLPMMIAMQGSDLVYADNPDKGTFSGEDGGIIKAYNNHIEGAKAFVPYSENNTDFDAYVVNSAKETVPASVVAKKGGSTYNNFDTLSSMYSYTAQEPAVAKESVTTWAGRVNGGDFRWTFNNAVDDSSYEVNQALKSALVAYTSKLVSVGGNSSSEQDSSQGSTEDSTGSSTEETKPSETGSGQPATPGGYAHNVTKNELKSSVYSLQGNLKKGTRGETTWNGEKLTTALEVNSTGYIKFTAPSGGTLVLVANGNNKATNCNLNGKECTSFTDGIGRIAVQKGEVTITKKSTLEVFYIDFIPKGDETNTSTESTRPSQSQTDASTESTKPSESQTETKPSETDASTESTEPSQSETDTSTGSTKPSESQTETKPSETDASTESTRPSQSQTDASTESTEPSQSQTDASTESTKPSGSQTETKPSETDPSQGKIEEDVQKGEGAPDTVISTPIDKLAEAVLDPSEREQLKNGVDVKISLVVDDADKSVSDEDKAVVIAALNGYVPGQYLDIRLIAHVGTENRTVTNTSEKLKITLVIPDKLKNTNSAVDRAFAVIRVHDGEAVLLQDTDDADDTVTIETDGFSTYALVYMDAPKAVQDPLQQPTSGNTDNGSAQTGDRAPFKLFATIAMIAGLAYLSLYLADRRRTADK